MSRMLARQDGVEDLTLITNNNETAVGSQLHTRLMRNKIYTNIGEVLIAVNPYKRLNIYGDTHIKKYQAASLSDTSPHIYALAERAYRRMRDNRQMQAVIISGESGAGKTESAKLILHYVSSVSGSSQVATQMKKIILECNPLLESFGNAKTVRNNNSSRFGKYLELYFNDKAEPVGGQTSNFLLEKTRVTFQGRGERNFHIFYQLFTADSQTLQHFYLTQPEDFNYTSQSGTMYVDGMDDARTFNEVQQAMSTINMDENEKWQIFQTLAAILHIGNIQFEGSNTPPNLVEGSEYYVQVAAYLLGVDTEALYKSITHKKITMGGRRGSVVEVPQNRDQATQIRDALAKELFSRTFDHIISRVNQAMYPKNYVRGQSIGILDIYGFEIFKKNSFEQFCINYVNERLQQIFIELTIKGEQREYHQEQLPWRDVPFFDNKVVVELIEGSNPPGIMRVLDDTCKSLHAMDSRSADDGFLDKVQGTKIGSHPHLVVQGRGMFTIKHYAGDVRYTVDGFCFKNMDNLYESLEACMSVSQLGIVAHLWQPQERKGRSPTTSGTKIRTSCAQLVSQLMQCAPHYIRCIKPNEEKAPMYMEEKRVLHQVKYLGIVQNIKVKKAGYSFRAYYETFWNMFYMLHPKYDQLAGTPQQIVQQMCSYLSKKYPSDVPSSEWAFGVSKVFVSQPQTIFFLEELREQALDPQGYAEKVKAYEQADREAEKIEAKMKKPKKKGKGCVVC